MTTLSRIRRGALALLAVACFTTPATAQRSVPISGDRLSGFVLPVAPITGDIDLRALRVHAWTEDDTKRMELDGDVVVRVGTYFFRAESAQLWLNRLPTADGVVNQIALFFDRLENPQQTAGLGASGDAMLVTGSARGTVHLDTALLIPEEPTLTAERRTGEQRLAQHLRRLAASTPRLARQPIVESPTDPSPFVPTPGTDLPLRIELPPTDAQRPWLRAPGAILTFSADQIDLTTSASPGGGDENVVTAVGSIFVEYFADDPNARLTQLTLTAERAVIFADPGSLDDLTQRQIDVEQVRGIYLEGNVTATAENGREQVRAPRMFYDFTSDAAIMLDAVMRTYTRNGRVPVYARAREMRQIAEDQWTAEHVRVAASEYRVGHIALGAERMTITQRPGAGTDPTRTTFDSDAITLRANDMPFFYWPRFAGEIVDVPLRNVRFGSRDNDGVSIETGWALFPLLGLETPDGVDAEFKLDGYTKRGVGAGVLFDYDATFGQGELDLYGLVDDGIDRTSAGREVDSDDDFRGVALLEHEVDLSRYWTLQAQASFISDESYITTWREDDFRERREYETSAYLKYQRDSSAFTLLGQYAVNDFISNGWLLASQAYTVNRAPEITWRTYGSPVASDTITYTGETRVSRVQLAFETSTPRELGIRQRTFGTDLDDPLDAMLRAGGLSQRWVNRFDTRHEVSVPFTWGAVEVTPFIVGRFTAYDHGFEEYSSDADDSRGYVGGGVRLNTQFQRIDDSVESRALDLHRLRHIIEPNITLWYAHANVDQSDLPVYDPDVESLATGAAVSFGLSNVWQTQRGGPGRWRSVDVLRLDANLVLSGSDTDRESPVPRFYDYRPEYSQFGDHVHVEAAWLPSDTLSIVGESTFDLDESRVARGSIGAELRHSPLLTTWVEYRYIDASDNELLDVGWQYRLTPKYRVAITPQWDFRENDFRAMRVRVTRRFPDFDFTVAVRHDAIRDDTAIGASLGLVDF